VPPVVKWFRIYAAALAVLYLLTTVFGVAFMFFPAEWFEGEDIHPGFMGLIIAACSLPFALVFAVALFLQPKPWVWIYDIVLIAVGFGSCCILPASVALLIFWIKPETKAYFNRI
jgi:MFS family permease